MAKLKRRLIVSTMTPANAAPPPLTLAVLAAAVVWLLFTASLVWIAVTLAGYFAS